MAKSMARIRNGVVVNIEWHNDQAVQTDTLVDFNDRPVLVGDAYADGIFYRDDKKVLTQFEELIQELNDMREALSILEVKVNG